MADVFFATGGMARAFMFLRRTPAGLPQTLNAAIPDGDTVGVHLQGSGAVRFLGIDTPEKTFELPGSGPRSLDSPEWDSYLTNPLDPQFGPLTLNNDLANH